MTEREYRLRKRVDTLNEERHKLLHTIATMIGQGPRRGFRECVYCGVPTYGKACAEHKDLIQLDPLMGGTQA